MTSAQRWTRVALACSLLIAAAQCAPAFDRNPGARMRATLRCAPPVDAGPRSRSVVVGSAGGKVELTDHTLLDIPRGALDSDVNFTIRQMDGDTVGVEINPSVVFREPAELRLDVGSGRCAGIDVKRGHWSMWRSEDGITYERLPTARPWFRNQIVGELVENSYLIIAD